MPQEISLIPKEYKQKKGLSLIASKLGILAMALAILSLLVYGGLIFYKKGLEKDILPLKKRIEELNQNRDKDFEKEVKSLDKTLKNLKIVLKNHFYWSNLFSVIEELIVPQVSFSDFNSKLGEKDILITMHGRADGYTYLAKQLRSFEQNPFVLSPKVENISLGTEGGIEFDLDISFNKDILIKK